MKHKRTVRHATKTFNIFSGKWIEGFGIGFGVAVGTFIATLVINYAKSFAPVKPLT